ncbi:PREDICTED: probable G-protein coupled receptor 112 [Chrysochloris asiatica]|uniref:Adhesion G-protein coupled receptor G4 n=1 Tax=Chrysochloris asiatica TaxID=185453 RepID=A0A9B0U8R7_CHRAS|nr:PREDICTED: probable G-protein coupled receptor 112 [Chrysochloris asiatica]
MDDNSSDWIAFSYVINNTFLGREDIDLGLAGDHQQLILYNLGKTFYIRYHLTPFQWHTVCLIWDGVKGRLELFLNKERLLVMMDQPQNLKPSGTLVLGHFPKNGDGQVRNVVPGFTGSLYYFQLWDHILEIEDFMKCLDGNVVSWEEDVWLTNKIIPTVDKRLRCFVSDKITTQGTSRTISKQVNLTTPSQITGLKPQKTLYSSSVMSKSIPVFASDHITVSYSKMTSLPLESMTTSKNVKPSVAETSTISADTLSTLVDITLPTKSTSIITIINSKKTSKFPSSERMMTSKMAEALTSETSHQTTAADFLYTSEFTKNSVASKTSSTRSQSAIIKTTSLLSSIESMSMSATSWPKHKSTDFETLPISTAEQVFLASSSTGTSSATTTHIGTASAFSPESELISTVAPVDSLLSRNQTISTLATTDMETAFTVRSVTLPTRPIETTPVFRTSETELTSTNFQDVSSPSAEDAISTSMPKETSSMSLLFKTSSPFTGTQTVQTVSDDETTFKILTPGITFATTVTETIFPPTITRPVYTQNLPTDDNTSLYLSSASLASTVKSSASDPTIISETAWTSRPDQNVLTSINTSTILAFMPNENFTSSSHEGTSNMEHSLTTSNIITPPEESEATGDITVTTRYATALSKLTSPWFTNPSTSVLKSEFQVTTLLKTAPMSTVATNELLSTPMETVVPSEDITSTLADIKSDFSTKECLTKTETNSTIPFGETTALVPTSVTTQIFNATVTRKETTSHFRTGKSTTAATPEISPFSTMLEATDEATQMLPSLITISPFPNIEKITTSVDNKTATTEVRRSWFTSDSVKTTPKSLSSNSGTTEIFNSTHTYRARWTSETSPEGNSDSSPTSKHTQIFPELLDVSTRSLGTIFTITPTDRTAMSLSASTLPPQSASTISPTTPGPVTHMISLPVSGSAVTSMMVHQSDETKVTMPEPSTLARPFSTSTLSEVSILPSAIVTTASMTTLDQMASTTSSTMPTHIDSILTTSEATGISVSMTPVTVPSLTEAPVPSLRIPTPVTTKADTTFTSSLSDTVTPPTHILTSSTSLPDKLSVVSSTPVFSTASTPITTQPTSQVALTTGLETSTHALSFPYTFSGDADVLSLVTGTTEPSVVNETRPVHTSANKLTTSVDIHSSQSSTHLVNTPVPILLMTGTSTISSNKEPMITSLGNTSRTIEATEMSSSKNSFISYSQGTSSLEMTDMGFSETIKISSHQTHSPSEVSLETLTEGNSVSSATSGSTSTTPTLSSNNTVGAHSLETSSSLGKTALPSQALTITTVVSPEKESMSAISEHTPGSVEMTVSSTSVTHPVSYHQDTSFIATAPSGTTRLSNSMNINATASQVSPSLTNFNSTLRPTRSMKVTTYLSSNTGKMTSLLENTSLTDELTKSTTSMNISISHPQLTPSIGTPLSLTSFRYLPHSTEFSTTKTSPVPISHKVEFPVLGTVITSSNAQSLLKTSWNTPTAIDSQFPISIATHVPTPVKMETETLQFVPESLPTFTTSLVSEDVTSKSSISTSGMLPTFGLSESPLLPTSSRAISTTLTDMKHTFEKKATSVTAGITFPSKPSGAAADSMITKATTLPMQTWISSSLHSGSPLATAPKAPQVITSSTVEGPKSTFLTSDLTSTHPFTNFATLPVTTVGTILTKTTPTPSMTNITIGFPNSLPMSTKTTDDNIHIFTSPGALPRTTVMVNSRTVSQLPSFSRMNMSPLTTDHTLSIGSIPLSSHTIASSWSTIPAVSTSPTLVLPKPTLDPLPNITTTTVSFPLTSTEVTHLSTAAVSSLISSSFEATRLDCTPSFRTIGTVTSTSAAKSTVSFYSIEMNFSVFDGESRIPIASAINEFAEYWLNSIFQDSEFALDKLATQIKSRDTSEEEIAMDRAILEQKKGQGMATISRVAYSCVCQVIMKANSSLEPTELMNRIKSKIHGNLTHGNFTQDQLVLLVKSEHISVRKLEPGKCKADETASKFKGTYKWLLTNPTEKAQTRCIKNEESNATRICSISIISGESEWEKPKFKQCKLLQGLPDKIVDLANITINDENADDVAVHILNLINESPPLDEKETKIIISKLSDISQCDEISMNLTQIILQIINIVLGKQNDSASDLHEVNNEILRIIDRAGHKMEFFGRTANLTVARLALAVLRVDHTFEGMAFGIRSYKEGTDPEIYLGEVPLGKILASIYLPKSVKERIPLNNLQTILFNFFGRTSLFKTKNFAEALTTYVVSASISDMSIQNLADPVVITLKHIEGNRHHGQFYCAFWDFGKNNGLGGWNTSGCKVNETNVNYTICQCDHLTHFGVLMDLSRSPVDTVNERILVLITYTGCGISSIFLGIAIVTYIVFHKLRKDYPSKILVNLCMALLMLNMVFLVNSWSASFQNVGLCITAAAALHYFLLVSLTWMGLEAVHMYFALVKVFNTYVPNYILKFCLIGWGIPAILVAIILSVKKDLYGIMSPVTPFCWIKDDSIFYISVVAYFCLIFVMNLSMFCTVLAQLNSMKAQSQKIRRKMILQDLKGTTSLTFLLGLTWGFAFFAWGPMRILFLYLFAIFNTLQGFLIFVFYCAMKESVREQWQIHIFGRWSQLDNSSDVSSRCGLNVGYKQERRKKMPEHKWLAPPLKSTGTNSPYKCLGSTQGIPSDISHHNGEKIKRLAVYTDFQRY